MQLKCPAYLESSRLTIDQADTDEYSADADDCPQLNNAFNLFPVRQQLGTVPKQAVKPCSF